MPFFCPRIPSRMVLSHHASLGSSRLWQFVFWLGCFPHDQTGVMGFWKGDHRGKAPFSSGQIKDTWLITVDTDFDGLSVCVVRFLTVKSPHPSMLYSLEGVTMHRLHLRSGELCSTSLRAEYPHKLFGILLHDGFVFFSPRNILITSSVLC